MQRTKSTINNLIWAFLGQGIGLIISFIARIIFIKILGAEYLGLNGLFTNILTVLTLAELGVGSAIIYSLYKPLAEKDNEKLKMLMNLYKKVYRIIGIIILIIGMLITPFLNVFIKDMPNIANISLIYILFVINTSVSYFYSFKRNLIIADQNRYIATIYRYACYIVMNIIQIAYILTFKEYFGFLIIQIVFTIIENILVSIKADKMYPYLKEKEIPKLDKETKNEIIKNTKAMMMHKVGGIVVNSTDNILISIFVGLTEVGKYSNYILIITALNTIISQIYNSLTAGVGNLYVEKDKNKMYEVFKKVNFLTFTVTFFSSIFLMILFNDAIQIMSNKEYLFTIPIVFVIVLNFYIATMRKSVLSFREATGLFYKDRYKAILEAGINLLASIILAKQFGIIGILIGTTISSITTCVWIEPYILYKYCFGRKLRQYFFEYFKYIILTLTAGGLCFYICSFISLNIVLEIILKVCITLLITFTIFVIFFRKSEEYIYFINLLKSIIKNNIIRKIFNITI